MIAISWKVSGTSAEREGWVTGTGVLDDWLMGLHP